jgi:hypothetical protein
MGQVRSRGMNGNGGTAGVKEVRVELTGDAGVPWNVKILWSSGELIHEYVHCPTNHACKNAVVWRFPLTG